MTNLTTSLATLRRNVGIDFIEVVATFALGLPGSVAKVTPTLCDHVVDVLARGAFKKMAFAYTQAVVAPMQHPEIGLPESEAVSGCAGADWIGKSEDAVAAGVSRTRPYPAVSDFRDVCRNRPVLVNKSPEAFFGGYGSRAFGMLSEHLNRSFQVSRSGTLDASPLPSILLDHEAAEA